MKSFKNNAILLLSCISFILACNNPKQENINNGKVSDKSEMTDSSKTMKVYILPAPLQIATATKAYNTKYAEKLLVPTNKSIINYPTNYLKALNLGVCGIDMGYSTVYDQKQSSLYYLSKIQKLTEELGVAGGFNVTTLQRFKNNMENQDSLYYIILQSFNDVHKYFQESDRASTGLLIITGSFIEGLYLTTGLTQTNNDSRLVNLLAQHQIFLDNLIELLGFYNTQAEVSELSNQMKDLKTAFKGIPAPRESNGANKTNPITISDQQLNNIMSKIAAIRHKIVD